MEDHQIQIRYQQYASINDLKRWQQELINKAAKASQKAYAPYSNFQVGCAILLENGAVVTGANQENASYPVGSCAEAVALGNKSMLATDSPTKAIAVFADDGKHNNEIPATPCGKCRQLMWEEVLRYNQDFELIIYDPKKPVLIFPKATDLLPLGFRFSNSGT